MTGRAPNKPGPREWAALAVLTGAGIALRAWGLGGRGFWTDEMETFRLAEQPVGSLFRFLWNSPSMPLYFLTVKPFLLFGQQEWIVRLPSVLFGAATVPAVWALARKATDGGKTAAFSAAALAAVSPPLVFFSQMARPYAMLTFFSALNFFFYLESLSRPDEKNRRVVLLEFFSGLIAVYTSLVFALPLLLQFLAALAFRTGIFFKAGFKRKPSPSAVFAPMAVLLCLTPWAPAIFNMGRYEAVPTPEAASFFSMDWIVQCVLFFAAGFPYDMTWHSWLAGGAFLAALLAGFLFAFSKNGILSRFVLAFCIVGICAMKLIFVLQNNQFFDRYFLIFSPLLLAFCGAAAAGSEQALSRLSASERRTAAVAAGIFLSALFLPSNILFKERNHFYFQDWRESVAWIEERARPGDAIVATGLGAFMLDYYLGDNPKKLQWKPALTERRMRRALASNSRQWVLFYEAPNESLSPRFRAWLVNIMDPSTRKPRVWTKHGVETGLVEGVIAAGGETVLDTAHPAQARRAARGTASAGGLRIGTGGWAAWAALSDGTAPYRLTFSGAATGGNHPEDAAQWPILTVSLDDRELRTYALGENSETGEEIALNLQPGSNGLWFKLDGGGTNASFLLREAALKPLSRRPDAENDPVHLKYAYWMSLSGGRPPEFESR